MIQFAKKVSRLLVKAGKLDPDEASELLAEALKTKTSFTELLTKKKVIEEGELLACIGRVANIAPIDLVRLRINTDVLAQVPQDVATDYNIFPIERIGNILTIAIANPFDVLKLDDIRIITGCQLRPVVSTLETIQARVAEGYKSDEASVGDLLESFEDEDIELKDGENEEGDAMDLASFSDKASPVVKMVNKVIVDAVAAGVSDIHIEPFEKKTIVRYRKDGRMHQVLTLPKRMQNNITSRIKIMAKLDIAEKHRPQDGDEQGNDL